LGFGGLGGALKKTFAGVSIWRSAVRPVTETLSGAACSRGLPMRSRGGKQMQKISTCLWFDGKAEEAMNFYMSIFRNSKVVNVMRCGEAGPGPKGSVLAVTFELEGQEFIGLNGGPHYQFTPAISMFVKCGDQAEVDDYWEKLLAGGGKPMQCGWLTDKYGVSWQIVPTVLGEMLQDKDTVKSQRAMRAMMTMVKLDIAAMRKAFEGR
jgi:two-component system sensor histidine kinase QseC